MPTYSVIHIIDQEQFIYVHNRRPKAVITEEELKVNIFEIAHQSNSGFGNTLFKISEKYYWRCLENMLPERSLNHKHLTLFVMQCRLNA